MSHGASATEGYEAIVIGAGPAGSTAARLLSQMGHRVLLLERELLPRYKACGGGLGPKSIRRLPFPVSELPHVRLSQIAFRLRGESPVIWDLPQEFPFYMVMRSDLDYRLAMESQAAGTVLRAGEGVREVHWDGSQYVVRTDQRSYCAPFLVGTDGATGIVRRSLGLESRTEHGVALECEIEVPDHLYAPFEGVALFDVEAAPDGYGWVFPKKAHLSVGLGSMRPTRSPLRVLLKQFIVAYGLASPAEADNLPIHVHPIPIANPAERARHGNAILAGDAAGVADGFGGEGICYAMASGELAAETIAAALGGDGSCLEEYEGRLDRLIRQDHGQANLMGRIVRRFPDAGYRILTSVGEGKSVLIPLLLGEITFGEALRCMPRLLALDRSGHGGS